MIRYTLLSPPVKCKNSYSGYGKNKGVVPLYCEDLFVKMAELQKENPDNQYQVFIAFQNSEYGIFGEGSQISTNQKRESTVFSILIG